MLCYVMVREVTKALPHSHGDYSNSPVFTVVLLMYLYLDLVEGIFL